MRVHPSEVFLFRKKSKFASNFNSGATFLKEGIKSLLPQKKLIVKEICVKFTYFSNGLGKKVFYFWGEISL